MRATRVRVAAIARGQNARARVDVRRIDHNSQTRTRFCFFCGSGCAVTPG
jgi:hypothetical protein